LNVLCVDTDSVGLAFCWRCVQAGHKVKWFVKEKPSNHKDCGEGFGVERTKNWAGEVKWADLIFPTGNDDYIKRLDFFRRNGAMVFGPTADSAALEIERARGMAFLEKHGIEVPEYRKFAGLDEAEAHVRKTEEQYVFKTLGDNEDKSLSYVSKSPADMIARIQYWKRIKLNPKGPVILQKFVKGIEMGVSRWMGTKGFIGLWDEHFEHKKLMSDDCGPNTGEMGTVQAYTPKSKLGEDYLAKLEGPLQAMGHTGDMAVGFIIDDAGKAWPTEFTNRPGWPAMNIMLTQHRGDPAKWMLDALRGRDTLKVTQDVAVGLVLAQPDFPYSAFSKAETSGIPVYGAQELGNQIQPQSVSISTLPAMDGGKMVEKPTWTTCGDYLAVVTGTGGNVSAARKKAYDALSKVDVPNKLYRDDVGERLKEKLPVLHKLGYATAFNY
jgi:phosphoribosylamine--glycine ligase